MIFTYFQNILLEAHIVSSTNGYVRQRRMLLLNIAFVLIGWPLLILLVAQINLKHQQTPDCCQAQKVHGIHEPFKRSSRQFFLGIHCYQY